jgi:drug/metabolite transporter (DMT)-like permease
MPTTPTPTRSRLEILGAALLFSTGGAAIKAVQFTGWQVAGLRSGVAAAAVWLLLPQSRRMPRGTVLATLLTAVAYAATLVLYVLANRLTTAANTIFLQSTAPLYLLLLGPLVLREHIRGRDLGFMVPSSPAWRCSSWGARPASAPRPTRWPATCWPPAPGSPTPRCW